MRVFIIISSVVALICMSQASYAQAIVRDDFITESVAARYAEQNGILAHGKTYYDQETANSTIKAVRLVDVINKDAILYITVNTKGDGVSYLDYDELDNLIGALVYIESFVDIKLRDREREFVYYKTKDGLRISVHSANMGNDVYVTHTKYVIPIVTELNGKTELSNFIQHLKEAKTALDALVCLDPNISE